MHRRYENDGAIEKRVMDKCAPMATESFHEQCSYLDDGKPYDECSYLDDDKSEKCTSTSRVPLPSTGAVGSRCQYHTSTKSATSAIWEAS